MNNAGSRHPRSASHRARWKTMVAPRSHRRQSRNAPTAETQMEPRGLQRFIGRQLGLVLGECRAQGTRSQNSSPVSLGYPNQRPQQVPPRWGRFLDIRIWSFKVLVKGDHAIAAVRTAGDGVGRCGCCSCPASWCCGRGSSCSKHRAEIARVKPVFKEVKLNLFSPMASERNAPPFWSILKSERY